MGNYTSNVAHCNNCNLISGDNPVFYLYNNDEYSGNYLCKLCYLNKDKIFYNIHKKKILIKSNLKCDNCKTNDSTQTYVKIHWSGKHNNKIFCNNCLLNKSYRTTYKK